MKLDGLKGIKKLEFDITSKKFVVIHTDSSLEITQRLESLNLGASLVNSRIIENADFNYDDTTQQINLLWTVLIINFVFFIIEIITGFFSGSMGLVADSLDMLADAVVYGLSLWAVGKSDVRKKRVATLSGYFQLVLAGLGLTEVVRRFLGMGEIPDFRMMIGISVLALIANSVCLFLLQKSKSREAHMKASMIFTSNDVIINAGVIAAGVFVLLTHSKYPDLIIGTVVFLIVVRGALRILQLGK